MPVKKTSKPVPLLPVANDLVALPDLDERACCATINLLSMRYHGLIEFAGSSKAPLVEPWVQVGAKKIDFSKAAGRKVFRERHWIPTWELEQKDFKLTLRVVTPPGQRGWCLDYELVNKTKKKLKLRLGAAGRWEAIRRQIYQSETLAFERRVSQCNALADRHVVLSAGSVCQEFALAVGTSEGVDFAGLGVGKIPVPAKWNGKKSQTKKAGQAGTLSWSAGKEMVAAAGASVRLAVVIGAGLDDVSAVAAAVELRRQGPVKLLNQTRQWLTRRCKKAKTPELEKRLNENLFFSLFFAAGECVDTGELVSLTSRSPRYYVSAGYWDRDSLLWAFPATLMCDRPRARRLLEYGFGIQGGQIGVHSRFIDGAVLEPGFELDELCAPVIALAQYTRETGDLGLIKDFQVRRRLRQVEDTLREQRHAQHALYRTTSSPSDDFQSLPYLTVGNVLAWRALTDLAWIYEKTGRSKDAERCRRNGHATKEAVFQLLTGRGPEGRMFVWSSDLQGETTLGSEPPGCLLLMPHWGFCQASDPTWKRTAAWLRSGHNPHWYAGKAKPFGEMGCAHAPHPWCLALANACLAGFGGQVKVTLEKAPLDHGLACEGYDESTGLPKTGEAFATAAGFLAFAVWKAFGGK